MNCIDCGGPGYTSLDGKSFFHSDSIQVITKAVAGTSIKPLHPFRPYSQDIAPKTHLNRPR